MSFLDQFVHSFEQWTCTLDQRVEHHPHLSGCERRRQLVPKVPPLLSVQVEEVHAQRIGPFVVELTSVGEMLEILDQNRFDVFRIDDHVNGFMESENAWKRTVSLLIPPDTSLNFLVFFL